MKSMDNITQTAIDALDDENKLHLIVQLTKSMTNEFKQRVVAELVPAEPGETQVTVTSNEKIVCVNFGRPLAWFAIPKDLALQLGVTIMQHAGAKLEQIARPDAGKSS